MEHLRRKLEFFDYDIEEYDMISKLFGLIEEKMKKSAIASRTFFISKTPG